METTAAAAVPLEQSELGPQMMQTHAPPLGLQQVVDHPNMVAEQARKEEPKCLEHMKQKSSSRSTSC